MKALFVFISIIFFSPFLLLNTPAFGQEDRVCLAWGERCKEWREIKKIICSCNCGIPVVSPVTPFQTIRPNPIRWCRTIPSRECAKRESYCKEWGNRINFGRIRVSENASVAEAKTILARVLNMNLKRRRLLGATINNPILPSDITIGRNGRVTFHLKINVTIELVGRIIWGDPIIAVGYNYFIDHGPRVKDIQLPEGIGDNKYNLWVFNPESNDFTDSGVELVGGEKYKFETPIRKFSIRGIEVDAGLDPKNQRAFPTGLSFDRTGKVSMRMVPITVDTDKQ
ncbi:MAG: hypothetical protein D3907_02090 [Candidatus Electrothrix sp. AUS3]|nr:hypothetical protein [Candidatus Electrothrix gigas]